MRTLFLKTALTVVLMQLVCIGIWAQETIDFEGLAAGTIVNSVAGDGGSVVGVFGYNPGFGGGTNAAMIFDSSNPTGRDWDLGTPNEDFGGPGIGLAGESGSPYENNTALGNLLIISEDLDTADPDDADRVGAYFVFDFSGVGSGTATITSITLIDVEAVEPSATVALFHGATLLAFFNLPQTGDNGVKTVPLGPTPGVDMMYVELNGSGAIDNIVFTPDDGNGGEGCTPGYWKNHLEDWPPSGLSPGDDFDTTFGVDLFDPDITLEQAVNARGGGVKKLARHGTAALINAGHPGVSYPLTTAEVIAAVQAGDADTLSAYNELGCIID